MQHGHTNVKKKNVELEEEDHYDEKNGKKEKKSDRMSDVVMFGK
jgi:hypothetical protein